MEQNTGIKSGEDVLFGNMVYLFLGYSDYKRKWCVVADKYGNKVKIYSSQVNRGSNEKSNHSL